MADWKKKPGMQGLSEQLNSEPASMPFQSAAYEEPMGRPAGAKAAGMQAPQEQRAAGTQNATNQQTQAGMAGLSSQLGQQKAIGTYSQYAGIDPLKTGASEKSLSDANTAYKEAGGQDTKPSKVEWQGPIHTGPTGFVNYSDFRGANAGDIGAAATSYRNQLGSLQQKAREAAMRYEKSQDPKDRAAWLDATDAADRYEKTNQGGTALDRSLGSFTGQYDKANSSWDAEREDLGADVTNEEMRSSRAKEEAARAEKQKLASAAAAGDAAAQAQQARQAKADKLAALQGQWREMGPESRKSASQSAFDSALAAGGGASGGEFFGTHVGGGVGAMYSAFDASARAGATWDEDKKKLEDEINKLKQELA